MKPEPLVAAIEHVAAGGRDRGASCSRRAAPRFDQARAAALGRASRACCSSAAATRASTSACARVRRRGALDRRLRARRRRAGGARRARRVARLLPGVLGNDGVGRRRLVRHRPARVSAVHAPAGVPRRRACPTCCGSGDHAAIARWRREADAAHHARAAPRPARTRAARRRRSRVPARASAGARDAAMADLYVALLHHPVYDKNGAVVTTAVTNLDVHDIARLARTFGVRGFYVCTPVADAAPAGGPHHPALGGGPGRHLQRHPQGGARARAPGRRARRRHRRRSSARPGTLPRLVATSARAAARPRLTYAALRAPARSRGAARAAGLRHRLGAHRGGPGPRRRRPRAHRGGRATTTTCRSGPPPPSCLTGSATDDKTARFHEPDRPHRGRAAPQGRPGLPARRHRSRARAGGRGRQGAHPGLRGHGARPLRRREPRDLHGAQDVVRRRRRAHLPGALAAHRQDRGRRCAARCAARSCTTCASAPAARPASPRTRGAEGGATTAPARGPRQTRPQPANGQSRAFGPLESGASVGRRRQPPRRLPLIRDRPSNVAPSWITRLCVSTSPKSLPPAQTSTRAAPSTSPRTSPSTTSSSARTVACTTACGPTTSRFAARTSPLSFPSIRVGSANDELAGDLGIRSERHAHVVPHGLTSHIRPQQRRAEYRQPAGDCKTSGGAAPRGRRGRRRPGRSRPASSGGTDATAASTACGQRGWNAQPGGGDSGLGTSPAERHVTLRAARGSGIGHRGEQRPRVGMARVAVDLVARSLLDDAAEVHDRDAVAEVLDDAQVVRDEEQRQPERCLQVLQQVQDLRLDRHVERRDRLVGDDEARLDRERARDADALALPAAELVRVALGRLRRQARPARAARATRARRSLARADAVDREALADDARHAHARIRASRTDPGRRSASRAGRRAARAPRRPQQRRAPRSARRPPSARCRRRSRRPSVDLPQPDSPTSPSVSPGATVERHAVDGAHHTHAAVRTAPRPTGKCFCERRATSTSGAAHARMQATRWPGGVLLERRHGRRALRRSRSGQRSRNAQPLGSRVRLGHLPGNRLEARAARARASASSAAAPACTGAAGGAKSSPRPARARRCARRT